MNRSRRVLCWVVIPALCLNGCKWPERRLTLTPPSTSGAKAKAPTAKATSAESPPPAADQASAPAEQPPAAPSPPAQPVAYDAARDVSLMQENVLEIERLLNRGRFVQMRPYLDELYLIVGYLESRQSLPLVALTVRRATHLLRKPDLPGAAGEIARARQELGMMTDATAEELSALLDPVSAALARKDRQGAERALAQIHLEAKPGDLASAAREVRGVLASLDLDIARQSARLLALELKDLTEAIGKIEAALKPAAAAPAEPAKAP